MKKRIAKLPIGVLSVETVVENNKPALRITFSDHFPMGTHYMLWKILRVWRFDWIIIDCSSMWEFMRICNLAAFL